MNPADLIIAKRNGSELAPEQIEWLVTSYTRGEIPAYQISAFLMAVYFKGMTPGETAAYTRAMIDSGLIEVQSHSHLHAYCFIGPDVVDFNRGTHWRIAWATGGDLRLGIPEYRGASRLTGPQYFDPPSLRDLLHDEVKRLNAARAIP